MSFQLTDDLRCLLHVPRQQRARSQVLALAQRALVHHAQLIMGHEKSRRMK
jgi:hypothetical protein